MESFFSLLQKNVVDQRRWATRSELRCAIVTWIEHTYNDRRRQRPGRVRTGLHRPTRSQNASRLTSHNHRQLNLQQPRTQPLAWIGDRPEPVDRPPFRRSVIPVSLIGSCRPARDGPAILR
jgi:hypothetical protein